MKQLKADRMLAKRMSSAHLRVATQLAAAIALAPIIGCGDGGLPVYSVTGTVKVDSKPADGVMVIFCPTEGADELMKLRPYGLTGPDGTFRLTTFDPADGAPAGNYKVIMQWPAQVSGKGDERMASGRDRLRGRYMNLDRSQFTAKIEDDTELPPFDLTSK
jgi:hypothetical protein